MNQVLIIEDEEKVRSLLGRIISLEGFQVSEAGDCKTATKKLEHHSVDIVVCDVKLPDGNGVEFTKWIREKFPVTEIILLTAYGNIPDSVQAIKNGAFDYITKGDDNHKIIPLLYKAMQKVELSKRVLQLEKQLGNQYSFGQIIGKSQAILHAIALGKKVADTDTTVLLTGETGTGKEVFARAIHQASRRSLKNFVAINCAAFSKELLESEMFGFRAGAFTGASRDKKGLFEEADQGTIFLDEIGEMSLDLQAKLLRVIETGEIMRIGETRVTRVNVRIIAATHRDLMAAIENGSFREDLYYRISVFQISLPPLRERMEDIPLFAQHFLQVYALKTKKKVETLSGGYMNALLHHSWKGNIRELKNVVERSVILTSGEEVSSGTLPPEFEQSLQGESGKFLSAFELASAEKIHIQKVLNYTHGNKTRAAELLHIALTTLYRKMEEYGIK